MLSPSERARLKARLELIAQGSGVDAIEGETCRALLADLEAAEQKLEPFCPNCGKHNLKETVTEIHKPFGNRGELSYEAPVIKCADCTFEWTDSRRESAEAEATIRFLGKSLRAAERERDALREAARWIPVSERLPEEDRPVLIAVRLPVDDHAEEVDSAVEVREGTIYTAPNMVIASLYDGSEASDDEVLAWQEKPTFPATPKEQAR